MDIRTSQSSQLIGITKLPKNQPITNAPQVEKTQPQTDESPKIETGPKLKPTVPSRTSPPVINDDEVGQIQDQGGKVPSKTLKQEASFVPEPGELLKAIKALKHVDVEHSQKVSSQSKKEIVKDSELVKQTSIPTKNVKPVHREGDINPTLDKLKPQVSDFTSELRNYERSGASTAALSDLLKDSMKRLDKTNTIPEFMGKQAKINSEIGRTQAEVQNLIAGLSSKIDFSFHLKTLDDKQLELLVTEAIGQNKGYDAHGMLTMSDKKIAFRDAVIRGIKAGLEQQIEGGNNLQGQPVQGPQDHGQLAQKFDAIRQSAKSRVQAMGSDSTRAWALTMLTDKEIHTALAQSIGQQKPFIMDAVIKGLHEGLPNQASANQITLEGGFKVPAELSHQGKTYDSPIFLNKGGYGVVALYTNPLDKNDTIVLKQPIASEDKTPQDLFREASEEIRAHRDIQGKGHKNILGFQGVIRGENDQLLLLIETAPNGDVNKLSERMSAMVRDKSIQPETRDLIATYMMKGILEGGVHMQETRQGHHLDFKTPNIMIGGDGEPKIGDFGTSGLGVEKVLIRDDGVANPTWKSPERIGQKFNHIEKAAQDLINTRLHERHGNLVQQLMGLSVRDDYNGKDYTPTLNREIAEQKAGETFLASKKTEADAIIARIPKQVIDQLKSEAVQTFLKTGTGNVRVENKRKEYVQNAINSIVLEELKPQYPNEYNAHHNIAMTSQALKILELVPPGQRGAYTALSADVEQIKNHKGDIFHESETLRTQIGQTAKVAKADTWAIGVVATELLLGGDVSPETRDAHNAVKGKVDGINAKLVAVEDKLSKLDATVPKNEVEREAQIKQRLEIVHERDGLIRERVRAQQDFLPHMDGIGMSKSYMSDIEDVLKDFASNDKRLVGEPVELNVRAIAKRYEKDPRFSGQEFKDMFATLTGKMPPMHPQGPATQQEQADYDKAASRYKRNNHLDDVGLAKAQEKYLDAMTQFKNVIEFESRKGVGARDKLLNGLLHPDPEQRITLSAALQNSIFKNDRIDKPEIGLLVRAINSKNPNQELIKQLEARLLNDHEPTKPELQLLMHVHYQKPPQAALILEVENHVFKGAPLTTPKLSGAFAQLDTELSKPNPDSKAIKQILGAV